MSLFSIVYLYTHSFNDVIVPHDVFHYHLRTKKDEEMTKDTDSPRPPPTMAKAEPEPSSSSTGDYGSPGKDILGLPSNFFKQFHSPEKKNKTHQAAQTWYCMKRASQSTKEAWLKATWLWMKGQTPVDPPWGDSWQRTILIWTPRICKHLQWH